MNTIWVILIAYLIALFSTVIAFICFARAYFLCFVQKKDPKAALYLPELFPNINITKKLKDYEKQKKLEKYQKEIKGMS